MVKKKVSHSSKSKVIRFKTTGKAKLDKGGELLKFNEEIPKDELKRETKDMTARAKPSVVPVVKVNEEGAKQFLDDSNKDPQWLRTFSLIILALILLFWIMIIVLSTTISTGQQTVLKNVTIISYSAEKLSFADLINITDPNYNQELSLMGYLRVETVKGDVIETTTKYVVDDYGNKIKVSTKNYDELFAENSNKKYSFNMTGTYHNTLNGFVFETNRIVPQKKELIETKNSRMENVTLGDSAGIRINLANGWIKVAGIVS